MKGNIKIHAFLVFKLKLRVTNLKIKFYVRLDSFTRNHNKVRYMVPQEYFSLTFNIAAKIPTNTNLQIQLMFQENLSNISLPNFPEHSQRN